MLKRMTLPLLLAVLASLASHPGVAAVSVAGGGACGQPSELSWLSEVSCFEGFCESTYDCWQQCPTAYDAACSQGVCIYSSSPTTGLPGGGGSSTPPPGVLACVDTGSCYDNAECAQACPHAYTARCTGGGCMYTY